MKFNEYGQVDGDYCYLDDLWAQYFLDGDGNVATPGWYTKESVEGGTVVSANDTIVPFMSAVQILSDCGGAVTFAGEVRQAPTDIEVLDTNAGGCTTTGNCSPVNRKLADIGFTSPDGGITGPTSVWLMNFNEYGQVNGDYCYLDDLWAQYFLDGDGNVATPGWYTKESVEGGTVIAAGNVDILAGEMVQILSDCGGTLTVPDPTK